MRRWSGALILALSLGLGGCEDEMSDAQIVAARADQTLRQLIAGMNAQKPPVLKTLLVMTSTTGGAPRPLRDEEVKTLVFPEPPFAYAGPGAPGFSGPAPDPLVRPPPPTDPGPARPTPDQRRLVTEVVRVRKTPREDQGASVPVDDPVLTETDDD